MPVVEPSEASWRYQDPSFCSSVTSEWEPPLCVLTHPFCSTVLTASASRGLLSSPEEPPTRRVDAKHTKNHHFRSCTVELFHGVP